MNSSRTEDSNSIHPGQLRRWIEHDGVFTVLEVYESGKVETKSGQVFSSRRLVNILSERQMMSWTFDDILKLSVEV